MHNSFTAIFSIGSFSITYAQLVSNVHIIYNTKTHYSGVIFTYWYGTFESYVHVSYGVEYLLNQKYNISTETKYIA